MDNGYKRIRTKQTFAVRKLVYAVLLILFPLTACGQTDQVVGIADNSPSIHAFTNATIVTAPGEVLENATLVIRGGVIESVGTDVTPPADARVWNMEGKTIYSGIIDPHSNAGMSNPREQLDRGALSWNPQLRAQLTADGEYNAEDERVEKLRSAGITTAMSVPPLGIFRGQTSVLSLGDGPVSDRVIRSSVAQSMSLTRTWSLGGSYPTSAIGGIAFIRQTLYDAGWYRDAHRAYSSNPSGLNRPETNDALAALSAASQGDQPLFFESRTDEETLRSLRFRDEFPVDVWVRGSGHEYRLLDVLADANVPLVLPVNFPGKPDVATPEEALNEDLSDLRHWHIAPENPARVANAGISFSFTADGLENPNHYLRNIRKAVSLGLDRETALAALTSNPAGMLGISDTHGTLQRGKSANILIVDGDLFDSSTKILDVWVEGKRFNVSSERTLDPRGEWELVFSDDALNGVLNLKGSVSRLSGTMTIGDSEIDLASATVRDDSRRLRVNLPGGDLDVEGMVRLTATISGETLLGWADIPGQPQVQFRGSLSAPFEEEPKEDSDENGEKEEKERLQLADIRPAMEYGRESIPDQPEVVVVQNATIWTMGSQGVMEGADMIVTRGQVTEVGRNLSVPSNAVVIDANGKHVTPGLIDAHLHSGSDGVNEVGGAIVPEVRLGDVLNINNIWMYRQLAGGLTTAHVMHGSANPIGGQNQHVKMRWGSLSDDLKIDDAPRTVKFALGENPKRVGSNRYPETRMGTMEIIADHFRMARDYEAKWNEWEENRSGIPPRKDLRLDALVDILNEDILVQSHSYRQDEILSLMRLAEEFDFTVKAFHHGVEAYKVAPELAAGGVGAVVWSDWSAFKIEAYDGTVYNARLLHEAGVLTSLHSDNSQIASRMNWEAAKMVGAGVDPEVALSMVTINTAKLLGIDHRVGSLESGKDADFVIWSGDPLSTLTKPEQTWVDGRKYFDLNEDAMLREQVQKERSQLIQLILEDK